MFISTPIGRVIALIGVLIFTSSANAAPILQGPTTAATGINGLVIGGVLYDISFSNSGRYDAIGEAPPTFLNDFDGARAAASAISVFLSDASVTGITNLNLHAHHVMIPHVFNGSELYAWAAFQNGVGASAWYTTTVAYDVTFEFSYFAWTDFTATVPEPGTLTIFGLGLAGLGLMRRRKRAA